MKNNLNAFNRFFGILSKRLGVASSWQRAFQSPRSMMGYLNRVPILLLGRSGRTWVLAIVAFGRIIFDWKRHQGYKGVAISLKVSHVVLMRHFAVNPLKEATMANLGHRVALTRSGLPKWIPRTHRKALLRRDSRVLRFWLSLCSLYRVVDYFGRVKIHTITKPGREFDIQPYIEFIPWFFHKLASRGVEWPQTTKALKSALRWTPLILTKSAPGVCVSNEKVFKDSVGAQDTRKRIIKDDGSRVELLSYKFPTSTSALFLSAHHWLYKSDNSLHSAMNGFLRKTGNRGLWDWIEMLGDLVEHSGPLSKLSPIYLGKLGTKDEPGKVRVFAMVDWFTQVALHPLHKMVFGILKGIPQDSTFDQDKGVRLGIEIIERTKFAASYDLSAATDRLPVVLQQHLVNYLVPGTGEFWKNLLVGREYALPLAARGWGYWVPKSVRYAVGQPMGALSSWALLALTHHFIVQYAAFKVGVVGWFKDYLVLGDDVVIFDKDVAAQYCLIMADLGVEIGFAKSLVSKDSFEFAKRFVSRGENLSAVSFKELDVGAASLDVMLNLLTRFNADSWTIPQALKLRGFGYKNLGKVHAPFSEMGRHLKLALIFLSMPGSGPWSCSDWVEWFTQKQLGSASEAALYFRVITLATERHNVGDMVPFPLDPVNLGKLEKVMDVVSKWWSNQGSMPRPVWTGHWEFTNLRSWAGVETANPIIDICEDLLKPSFEDDYRKLREIHKKRPIVDELGNEVINTALDWLVDWSSYGQPNALALNREDRIPRLMASRFIQLYAKANKAI